MTENCMLTVEKFLKKVTHVEPTLKAFTVINSSQILKEASALDQLHPSSRGSLHGILVAAKEVYDVEGYTCGWGTPIHSSRIPTRDSAIVSQLRAAGAIIAGITVSTEYAISRIGPTTNPFDKTRTPGASSQGSAAAVGANLVSAALGSQTIGSIIRPAAYCGCFGFKPTWGLLNPRGSMALAEPIDHPGMFARDISSLTAIAEVLQPKHNWRVEGPITPEVIIIEPWFNEKIEPEILTAINIVEKKLIKLGYKIKRGRLPEDIKKHEEQLVTTILSVGMAHNLGEDFDNAREQMSERIRDYILAGRNVSKEKYNAALDKREEFAQKLDKMFKNKIFITAATTGVAPLLAKGTGSRAPQRVWTLTGLPTISVPFGSNNGLPLGIQVGASRGADALVLTMGEVFSNT